MKEAAYLNYKHYLDDTSSEDPKKMFVFLADHLEHLKEPFGSILDVGCGNGELLQYLNSRFPDTTLVGIDVAEPLLLHARERIISADFIEMSGMDLPGDFARRFDVVSAVGVLDIFDWDEAESLIQRMMACCRPGGRVILLSPINEYGMDLNARHRKWSNNRVGEWERGNNIYAKESIRKFAGKAARVSFAKFDLGMKLPRRKDPQRTWTINAMSNRHQLINGLKLLMDLYLVDIKLD